MSQVRKGRCCHGNSMTAPHRKNSMSQIRILRGNAKFLYRKRRVKLRFLDKIISIIASLLASCAVGSSKALRPGRVLYDRYRDWSKPSSVTTCHRLRSKFGYGLRAGPDSQLKRRRKKVYHEPRYFVQGASLPLSETSRIHYEGTVLYDFACCLFLRRGLRRVMISHWAAALRLTQYKSSSSTCSHISIQNNNGTLCRMAILCWQGCSVVLCSAGATKR